MHTCSSNVILCCTSHNCKQARFCSPLAYTYNYHSCSNASCCRRPSVRILLIQLIIYRCTFDTVCNKDGEIVSTTAGLLGGANSGYRFPLVDLIIMTFAIWLGVKQQLYLSNVSRQLYCCTGCWTDPYILHVDRVLTGQASAAVELILSTVIENWSLLQKPRTDPYNYYTLIGYLLVKQVPL